MLDEIEQGQDPLKMMNILKTVWFICKVWQLDIQSQTIVNYWKKSEITGPIHQPLPQPTDYLEQVLQPASELADPEKEIERLLTHLGKDDCLDIAS